MLIETLTVAAGPKEYQGTGYSLGAESFRIGHASDQLNNLLLAPNDAFRTKAPLREGGVGYIPPISRQHCQIVLRDGKRVIEDLGSRTGTYVNGNRVSSFRNTGEQILEDGDVIGLIPTEESFLFLAEYTRAEE